MAHDTIPWRDYLTDDERALIERADAAKLVWQAANDRRAGIVNRAIQRARYALGLRGNATRQPASDENPSPDAE